MGLTFNPTQLQKLSALSAASASPLSAAAGGSPLASPTALAGNTSPLATAGGTGGNLLQSVMSLLSGMVNLMCMMVSSASGGANANAAASPFANSLPGGSPLAGNTGAATGGLPVAGGLTPNALNQPAAGVGTSPDGTTPANIFTANDYQNFLLAGSKGGTTQTAESIDSSFADPNSRFGNPNLPNDQFKAAVAGMYSNQFKAYALGLDGAFNPGDDINQLSNNLVTAQNTQMTPEAELLSKVAASYRGTGSLYNNPALQQLLVKWGRSDIASQPNVGDPSGDVQSIGGVVKALNEEQNPAIRQAWLQDIFDFAGNTPSSPSGAVPDLANYQFAVNYVKGGQFSQLLNAYGGVA